LPPKVRVGYSVQGFERFDAALAELYRERRVEENGGRDRARSGLVIARFIFKVYQCCTLLPENNNLAGDHMNL
jgi:hypothetical protein